jgi:hypothetical protein
MEDIKKTIQNLKDGQCVIVGNSDYGKAEILLKNNTYFLFEIPQFGGVTIFSKSYSFGFIDEIVDQINLWS